jgi:hypothetical protein
MDLPINMKGDKSKGLDLPQMSSEDEGIEKIHKHLRLWEMTSCSGYFYALDDQNQKSGEV